MSTKTTTTTTEVLVKGRRCVQGIRDNNEGRSGSTTGPVDWQRQCSVYFPWFQVANSNTVSPLSSCCLVLVFFSSYSFFSVCCMKYYQYCNHAKIFLFQVYTSLAYVTPTYRWVKELRVLMINKDVCKSLARKKVNEILIWSWNDSTVLRSIPPRSVYPC